MPSKTYEDVRLPVEAEAQMAEMRGNRTWDSALTTDEFATIRSVGFEPVGQVLGAGVFDIGYTGGYNCPGPFGDGKTREQVIQLPLPLSGSVLVRCSQVQSPPQLQTGEGVGVAGSDGLSDGAGWRVFVSHTSELRDFPKGRSYVVAVERAISACGHVIVDMADFPAADQPAAELCQERVRGCQVYVGVLGTRYGSPVRDMPEVSYTELEFDTATEAELPRLVFLLDTNAADVGIPPSKLIDHEFGARQEAFRRRVRETGQVTQTFTDPGTLGQLVERSLRELAGTRRRRGESPSGEAPAAVVAGEIPQEPLGSQPRAELLTALDAPGPGSRGRVVHALTGMRGVGKTHLAAAYARAKLAAGWRLVAWINAEDPGAVLAGLAEIAGALGLAARAGEPCPGRIT